MIEKDFFMSEINRLCVVIDYDGDDDKWKEYYKKLHYNFDPMSFARAIDCLIDKFHPTAYKKFPTISEIYAAKRESYQNNYTPADTGEYRSGAITAAWAHCFRLIWLVTDRINRMNFFSTLAEHNFIESTKNEEQVIDHYRNKYREIQSYLLLNGFTKEEIKAASNSDEIVPKISNDDIAERCGF